jgi:hypothetical protein
MTAADRPAATETMEPPKLFTPQLANKSLPLVRGIVEDILERVRELRGRRVLSKDPEADQEIAEIRRDLTGLMKELESLGVFYKSADPDVGLVDFPAKMNGEDVLLCWKSDEPRVAWYHSIEGGFAGRRPIPPALLEEN